MGARSPAISKGRISPEAWKAQSTSSISWFEPRRATYSPFVGGSMDLVLTVSSRATPTTEPSTIAAERDRSRQFDRINVAKPAGWPSISRKALSRQNYSGRCVSTACLARGFEDQSSGKLTLHHPPGGGNFRPTNHRYGHQLQAMMLPCEHPAYCRMRERSINSSACLTVRPGAPASCSRYGRSPDSQCSA